MDLPDYAAENRRHWDATADDWVEFGERGWSADEPTWGAWGVPDAQIPLLPADLAGNDVIGSADDGLNVRRHRCMGQAVTRPGTFARR